MRFIHNSMLFLGMFMFGMAVIKLIEGDVTGAIARCALAGVDILIWYMREQEE